MNENYSNGLQKNGYYKSADTVPKYTNLDTPEKASEILLQVGYDAERDVSLPQHGPEAHLHSFEAFIRR